jgi:glycosyltransferase involved in cell wall biosynthesis
MRRFGRQADMVVYQSEWARMYAGYLVGEVDSLVIRNGVDTSIFYPQKKNEHRDFLKYLFVQFNRDENKRWPEAAYRFHMDWRQNKKNRLTIVGAFTPELVDAGFDFFAGESVEYYLPVSDRYALADVYRAHDVLLFPAFADAAPNTVLEARACGLQIEGVNPIGGTTEMLEPDLDISLERMCDDYEKLFNLILVTKK